MNMINRVGPVISGREVSAARHQKKQLQSEINIQSPWRLWPGVVGGGGAATAGDGAGGAPVRGAEPRGGRRVAKVRFRVQF